jgi:hypothetical protein
MANGAPLLPSHTFAGIVARTLAPMQAQLRKPLQMGTICTADRRGIKGCSCDQLSLDRSCPFSSTTTRSSRPQPSRSTSSSHAIRQRPGPTQALPACRRGAGRSAPRRALRAQVMVRRICEASRKFAYLPNFRDYRAHVGDVCVIADVTECEFLPDGRANLRAKCRERCRIVETWVEDGTQGLHWCKVETVADEPCAAPAEADETARLARACAQVFEQISARCDPADVAGIAAVHGACPQEPQVPPLFCACAVLPRGARVA